MQLLYKPFGFIVGMIAGLLSKKVAAQVWGMVDDQDPPKATTRQATWGKIIGAAAIQGAVLSVVRTIVMRYGAKGFHFLTGAWPGEKRADPK